MRSFQKRALHRRHARLTAPQTDQPSTILGPVFCFFSFSSRATVNNQGPGGGGAAARRRTRERTPYPIVRYKEVCRELRGSVPFHSGVHRQFFVRIHPWCRAAAGALFSHRDHGHPMLAERTRLGASSRRRRVCMSFLASLLSVGLWEI